MKRSFPVALLFAAMLHTPAAAQTLSLVGDMSFDPALVDNDESENLSGGACIDGSVAKPVCLLVGDEKRYARFFSIKDGKIVPQETLNLLPPIIDKKAPEADAEGIAYADGYFYIVGSHSTNKKGEAQSSRHHLYRVKVDAVSGRPTDLKGNGTPSEIGDLDAIIAADPGLKTHVAEAPGEGLHGVNIEGIAVSKEWMFIGFRGPVTDKGAVILSMTPTFAPAAPVRSCRLPLGEGQGVRDLLAYSGGVLILAGPEMRWKDKEPLPHSSDASRLFFWDGNQSLFPLGAFPSMHPDGPEAMVLLESIERGGKLLMLSDGPGGGRPVVYRFSMPDHAMLGGPTITCTTLSKIVPADMP